MSEENPLQQDAQVPGTTLKATQELLTRARAELGRVPVVNVTHASLRGVFDRALVVGDLKLDPAMHTVTRAGEEIELTAKEFALLELLMRHPGQVLTRTRILEHVWDFAFDPVSNVVDQYVAYLRRKIDRPFGREDLETVRGTGYRLRASSAPMS